MSSIVFHCNDLYGFVVHDLKKDVVRKAIQICSPNPRFDLMIGERSFGDPHNKALKFKSEFIGEFGSFLLLVILHYLEHVNASFDVIPDLLHLRRSSKNLKNSS